jgi:alkanesulfonate monooxygenase SsuD/methylene tetrahydromethanopterin reductase-like flavin-dependent oxidoreductase (luciferase family)
MKLEIKDDDTALQIARKLIAIEDELSREYRKRLNLAKMAEEHDYDPSWLTEHPLIFAANTLKLAMEIRDTRKYVMKLFDEHSDPLMKGMLQFMTVLSAAAKR